MALNESDWESLLVRLRSGLHAKGLRDYDARMADGSLEQPRSAREEFVRYVQSLRDELSLRSGLPARMALERLATIATTPDGTPPRYAKLVQTGPEGEPKAEVDLALGEPTGLAVRHLDSILARLRETDDA